jgi:hypothetical protein
LCDDLRALLLRGVDDFAEFGFCVLQLPRCHCLLLTSCLTSLAVTFAFRTLQRRGCLADDYHGRCLVPLSTEGNKKNA